MPNDAAGWVGGFDLVIGNPPWEMPETDDRAFFQSIRPDISSVAAPRERAALVRGLAASDPPAYFAWTAHLRRLSAERQFFSASSRYPQSGQGRLNYYKLFLEGAWSVLGRHGHLAMVIPSGLATNTYERPMWNFLLKNRAVVSLLDFENSEGLFPAIDGRAKFSLIGLSRSGGATFRAGCWLRSTHEANNPSHTQTLSAEQLEFFSPGSAALPQFRSAHDLSLLRDVLSRLPRFAAASDWQHTTRLMFSSSDERFRPVSNADATSLPSAEWNRRTAQDGAELVAVYEGKMVGQYDHRQADIYINLSNAARPAQEKPLADADKTNPFRFAVPQYWIAASDVREMRPGTLGGDWTLAFCDVTSATNERTAIASILPLAGLTRSMPAIYPQDAKAESAAVLAALINSVACDYFARLNVAGNHLTQGILENLPVPELPAGAAAGLLRTFLSSRVLELTHTAWDLQPFARDLGYDGPPFCWNAERRFQLRCELDAAFFHLYGIARADVEYIMDTFPIVRAHDEKQYGRYRTKDGILAEYDRLTQAAGGPMVEVDSAPHGVNAGTREGAC